jgi:holo-[acyl-carrier protein] synthase
MIIGTGVDIIEISRIQAAIERNGERFIARVFTAGEREYCQARQLSAMHYAGRFAAKEAAFKALGTGWAGNIRWVDVEVEATGGAPRLKLYGGALARFNAMGGSHLHLTISHSRDYAVAMVIMESGPGI